jgi:hypothetical protein
MWWGMTLGTLNNSLRFRVLARDNFTCRYCGQTPPDVVLEIDHVVPKSQGGPDSYENLVTACRQCNHGKLDALLAPEQIAALQRHTPMPLVMPRRKVKSPKIKAARPPKPVKAAKVKPMVVKLTPKPKPAAPPKKRTYQRERLATNTGRTITLDAIPVANSFVHVGPDEFLTVFECSDCGFINSYEGDLCSCKRRHHEGYNSAASRDTYRCEDCDEELTATEYEDNQHRCEDCLSEHRAVYCWECDAEKEDPEQEYCNQCQEDEEQRETDAAEHVFSGGIPL